MDDVITLLRETSITNSAGDTPVSATVRVPLLCKVLSIGTNESYKALAVGLRPEFKFLIADYADYQGEHRLEFSPDGGTARQYSILRTYRREDGMLEITVSGHTEEAFHYAGEN